MIRILILLLSVAVWAGNAFANNHPITTLPDDTFEAFLEAPLRVDPIKDIQSKTSLEGLLSAEDKSKLEAILNQEMNRLQASNLNGMLVDSIQDDVSNGSIGQPLAEELEAIGRARSVIADLKLAGNFLLNFTGDDLVTLPVGTSQTIGNVSYTMGIGSIRLKPTHAELEIYLEIDVPGKEPLLFGSSNIKFTKNGGIVGDACLGLLADFAIDIVQHKSVLKLKKAAVDEETGSCASGTYVSIDCDGFQELSIDAEVIFSRDWLKPVEDNGSNRVKGDLGLTVASWDDILFTVDMDDFVLNRLEDVKFRVDSMVFDFSDTNMSNEVTYPDGYNHPLMNTELWKGFYINQFQVELPERLTGGTPKTVDAQHIIIDNTGFSGKVGVYPGIIPLSEGNLDGWAFSLDTFRLEVMQNQFQEVSFAGKINVPIFNSGGSQGEVQEVDCFSYSALINPGNVYGFTISNDTDFDVDMWQATAVIEPNSTIELEYDGSEFSATATLYGNISVNGDPDENGFSLNVPPITFDSLRISNKPDYFNPGTWGFPTNVGATIGDFGITMEEITITEPMDGKAALDFNLILNLTTSSLAVTAEGGIQIVGEKTTTGGGRHRWQLEEVNVNDIFVNASCQGVNLMTGHLSFYKSADNPDFGTGFYGGISANFRGIGAEIDAVAQFGSMDDVATPYKYFMVDAKVDFGNGGIELGGVRIKGFAGGIYRHMERPSAGLAWNQFSGPGGAFNENSPPPVGTSLSGIQYTPNNTIVMGFEATVILATTGSETSFNANLTLGMEFAQCDTNDICLDRIWFQGNGKFMSDLSMNQAPTYTSGGGSPNNGAMLQTFVMIDYSFSEQTLHANLAVHMNVENTLVGTGQASMYLNQQLDEWYIKIGEPYYEEPPGTPAGQGKRT